MLDLDMQHSDDVSIIRMIGGLMGEQALGRALDAVVDVPLDRHLVLDLAEVYALDDPAAMAIAAVVAGRAAQAESVIVAPHEDVAVRLVIHDVDRLVPMVHTLDQAIDIVRVRAGLVASTD